MINVILSGGIGSRLWPLSRKSLPKQYIPLFNSKSLFQFCIERNRKLADTIMIVGNKENYLLSRNCLQAAGIENYSEIIEAAPRNTVAAVAFAALASDPEEVLLISPSDHIIRNIETYSEAVQKAVELARQGYLITFGITPFKPETGYGYIEYTGNDVISFREKPSYKDAENFVESGSFLWNSGMFCFKAGIYLQELQKYEPALYTAVLNAWNNRDGNFLPYDESMLIPSKSIDYAVMERSNKIKVIPASFDWSDLGSFESIWEHLEQEKIKDNFVQNNLVLGLDKHIEFLNVQDLIVVNSDDAILVLSKNASQDVKKIYDRLEVEKPALLS